MAGKRASWGSVTLVSKGHYRIRYWGKDSGGTYRRMSETVHGTRRQAFDRLALLHVEHSDEHGSVTVGQAHDLWWVPWADRRCESGQMSANARRQFDSTWKNHVGPRWKDVQLGAVTPPDVQEWLLSKTNSTAMQCKTVLSRIMDRARFMGATDNDPFSSALEMPARESRESTSESYDAEELRAVWDALRGSVAEVPFLLCAFGSCRVGESIGVRCNEVSVELGVCSMPITRQVTQASGLTDTLKNRFSERTVAVPGPMGRRVYEVATARREAGYDWLVGQEADSPATQGAVKRTYRKLVLSSGIRYLPMQTLRASWQTMARYTLGIEPWVIERLMGHSVGGVTGQHYDRPHGDDYIRAVSDAYSKNPFADGWDD